MRTNSENVPHRGVWQLFLVLSCLLVAALVVVACSNGSSSTSASGMGTVTTTLSDPATCQAPNGPYSHVYVTITDVQANTSATASATGSGWVDLTPNLSKTPVQVDLLGQANNQCFLATLGDKLQLQAGTYQQIRLILASNTAASVSGNMCGSANNCVVLASNNSVHTLQLSSEAKTGIKIPAGQISSGGFTVTAGKTVDLDINFNTCQSLVVQGNGQYRLKPVLHAGEVSTTSTSINGTVLDASTGNPIDGTVLVAVEQKDSTGVDRIQMSTLADSNGAFVFCPLPSGTYDLVIVATRKDGVLYQPDIVTGVSVGDTVGTVKLNLPTATATSSVSLSGQVTAQNSAMAGTVMDAQLSALETIGSNTYTIPLAPTSTQSTSTLSVETAASPTSGPACPTGTYCANYTMMESSGGANVGAWASSGITFTANANLASYVVDGLAIVPGSGGTPNCSPSEVKTAATTLTGSGPYNVTGLDLAFKGCQ